MENLSSRILSIRGQRVMLDFDLADLYGVETRVLNQTVRRNADRFPEDFMFELTRNEIRNISQFVISSHRRHQKHSSRATAFTEHGVSMLSSVLRSRRAVQVNIQIMRAFPQARRMLLDNARLARKLDELERRYDSQFKEVFDALRELMEPPMIAPRRIGFEAE